MYWIRVTVSYGREGRKTEMHHLGKPNRRLSGNARQCSWVNDPEARIGECEEQRHIEVDEDGTGDSVMVHFPSAEDRVRGGCRHGWW